MPTKNNKSLKRTAGVSGGLFVFISKFSYCYGLNLASGRDN